LLSLQSPSLQQLASQRCVDELLLPLLMYVQLIAAV
jgi:hypothetical protein